ncbi:hypothetical protein GGI07_002370 [Coemansia sp. Benny D115]|nr:hypothetical protein GGI07_002370 [Coemansia sp. Benny D115]
MISLGQRRADADADANTNTNVNAENSNYNRDGNSGLDPESWLAAPKPSTMASINVPLLSASPTSPITPMSPPPFSAFHHAAAGGKGQKGWSQYTVGLMLLQRMWRMARTLHAANRRIVLYCGLLLVAKLAAEVVFYFAGRLPSEFYRVLGDRNGGAFGGLLMRCVLVVGGAGASKAALNLMAALWTVAMRRTLTEHTHGRYISRRVLYEVAAGGLDNPDQRVTQDIERLTTALGDVVPELLVSPFLVAYYTYKCWALSGALGPLCIYLYFVLGALASRLAMPGVIRKVCQLERAEGDFRFMHLRLVEFTESVAFFGGEARERRMAGDQLAHVMDVQGRLAWKRFWLGLVTQVFAYMGSTVSFVIIAVPVFMGRYDGLSGAELSSVISLNAFVSLYLIFCFTSLIEQTRKLSDVAGFATRIVQLWEDMDDVEGREEKRPTRPNTADGCRAIRVCDLSVSTPSGARLLERLDFELLEGQSLIVTGPNGVGKTSLLRVLCGLWQPTYGSAELPRASIAESANGRVRPSIMFLPQTPYIVAGSLRDQIMYPGSFWERRAGGDDVADTLCAAQPPACTDAELIGLLETVGLSHLLRQLEASADDGVFDSVFSVQFWLRALSPGEQQKMSVARVLFWRPWFACLDECTSSLDVSSEERVYGAMLDAGITLVSVGHRQELLKFHKRRLHLLPHGQYELCDI